MAHRTKAADLREQGREELVATLRDLKQEAFNLRFQLATGQLTKNSRVGEVKRQIAQVFTVIRERELDLAPDPTEFNVTPEPTVTKKGEKK